METRTNLIQRALSKLFGWARSEAPRSPLTEGSTRSQVKPLTLSNQAPTAPPPGPSVEDDAPVGESRRLGDRTIGHGYMEFQFHWRGEPIHLRLYGGPYRNKPEHLPGICMAKELNHLPHEISCRTADFQTPHEDSMRLAIYMLLDACLWQDYNDSRLGPQEWYVGCAGGIGRTGLFLACFAKIAKMLTLEAEQRDEDPDKLPASDIDYRALVRNLYHQRAIETEDQNGFLNRFTFPELFGTHPTEKV